MVHVKFDSLASIEKPPRNVVTGGEDFERNRETEHLGPGPDGAAELCYSHPLPLVRGEV